MREIETQINAMHLPVYLDYMATTPVDPRVVVAMQRCLTREGHFGNAASTTHAYGWAAEAAIAQAAEQVAQAIGAEARELIFTSGATESINLALKGAAQFYQRQGKHIVTLETEHRAVRDVCAELHRQGFSISYLKPQQNGLIDLDAFAAALTPDTILASVLWVNNEIGVVQPIDAIAKITREKGVLLHVDATQAIGKIPVSIRELPIDLMSFSAHKVYGPKGVGALWMRHEPRVRLVPQIHGGGHQHGIRSGTLATHQIVGMGEAFALAAAEYETETTRIRELHQRFWKGVSTLPGVFLNGDPTHRVPHNLNIRFEGMDGEALTLGLRDLAVSRGSACTSATLEPSPVLLGIGLTRQQADQSIRFSLGRFTTIEEIDFAAETVCKTVERLRGLHANAVKK